VSHMNTAAADAGGAHHPGTGLTAGGSRWWCPCCCARAPTDLMSVTRRLTLSRCALHAFTSSSISCDVCRQLLYLHMAANTSRAPHADATCIMIRHFKFKPTGAIQIRFGVG
jgi:hypothetical protein